MKRNIPLLVLLSILLTASCNKTYVEPEHNIWFNSFPVGTDWWPNVGVFDEYIEKINDTSIVFHGKLKILDTLKSKQIFLKVSQYPERISSEVEVEDKYPNAEVGDTLLIDIPFSNIEYNSSYSFRLEVISQDNKGNTTFDSNWRNENVLYEAYQAILINDSVSIVNNDSLMVHAHIESDVDIQVKTLKLLWGEHSNGTDSEEVQLENTDIIKVSNRKYLISKKIYSRYKTTYWRFIARIDFPNKDYVSLPTKRTSFVRP